MRYVVEGGEVAGFAHQRRSKNIRPRSHNDTPVPLCDREGYKKMDTIIIASFAVILFGIIHLIRVTSDIFDGYGSVQLRGEIL